MLATSVNPSYNREVIPCFGQIRERFLEFDMRKPSEL